MKRCFTLDFGDKKKRLTYVHRDYGREAKGNNLGAARRKTKQDTKLRHHTTIRGF